MLIFICSHNFHQKSTERKPSKIYFFLCFCLLKMPDLEFEPGAYVFEIQHTTYETTATPYIKKTVLHNLTCAIVTKQVHFADFFLTLGVLSIWRSKKGIHIHI